MKYSNTFKALAVGSLLAAVCSSVSFADDQSYSKGMDTVDNTSVITEEQQRSWEMKMLSWNQELAKSLQEKRDNMMLSNDNNDYQQDAAEISVEWDSVRERMVQN